MDAIRTGKGSIRSKSTIKGFNSTRSGKRGKTIPKQGARTTAGVDAPF